MARMLNGDEDIDTDLIPQSAKDIIGEMDYIDLHVDLKKGLKYVQSNNHKDLAEEEYIKTHKNLKKQKLREQEQKSDKHSGMVDFFWMDTYEREEFKNEVLPYRTIDVIFNKKNIFLNKQNPNPAGIYFDLYNRDKWWTALKIRDQDSIQPNTESIWNQDIPAFYSFKNFLPNYTEDDIIGIKKSILSSVTHTIKVVRLQKNLNSFFKTVKYYLKFVDERN